MSGTDRIEALTATQRAMIGPWVERWAGDSLRTGDTDWKRFGRVASKAYRLIGRPAPRIIALASPAAFVLAQLALPRLGLRDARVSVALSRSLAQASDLLWRAVGHDAAHEVSTAVAGAIEQRIRYGSAPVPADLWLERNIFPADTLFRAFLDDLFDDPDQSRRKAICESVTEALVTALGSGTTRAAAAAAIPRSNPYRPNGSGGNESTRSINWITCSFRGQFRLSSHAERLFYRDVCGLEPGNPVWKVERSVSTMSSLVWWWWPCQDFVLACARPTHIAITRDARGWPHSPDRPLIAFPDGWALCYWHGWQIPSCVVTRPEAITVAVIHGQENIELRRLLIERYGLSRYLRDVGAKPVHQDACGALYRTGMLTDKPITFVLVVNSTPEPDGSFKEYWLRVPPETRTAREAVAYTFGLDAESYRPVVET